MKTYIRVTKSNNGHNLPKFIRFEFDNDVISIIRKERIEFGYVEKNDGISIISRNGLHYTQIPDRSVSNLVIGKPYARRPRNVPFYDNKSYTRAAFYGTTTTTTPPLIDDKLLIAAPLYNSAIKMHSAPNLNNLTAYELTFYLDYIKLLIESKDFESTLNFLPIDDMSKLTSTELEQLNKYLAMLKTLRTLENTKQFQNISDKS